MAPVHPTLDEIRAQLDRVLASEVFATATRLRRFLRHVVERSLAGESDELKEYAIGVGVFDRDQQYDPRVDSIVRVEAGRLRTKIDEYYSGAGAADPVLIRMPRGSYAPVFEHRQSATAAAVAPASAPNNPRRRVAGWIPTLAVLAVTILLTVVAAWPTNVRERGQRPTPPVTIAVLPFACYSTDAADQMLAARLTDGVTSELTRIGTLGVVSRTTALQFANVRQPLKDTARALNVDIVVEASVETAGDDVRIQTRLVDAVVDRKGWIGSFDGRRADVPALQRRIAESIAAAARVRVTGAP
jgi:TolB-like protein